MAKKVNTQEPSAAPSADGPDMTLDEFCAGLSLAGVGSEMIGGFHLTQRQAACIKSSEAGFRARFAAYTTRAIK